MDTRNHDDTNYDIKFEGEVATDDDIPLGAYGIRSFGYQKLFVVCGELLAHTLMLART